MIGNLNFRTATPEDATQLQQIVELAFRAQDTRSDWTDNLGISSEFRVDTKDILAMITKPESVMLMATDDKGITLGTIGTSKRDANHARLFMLAVDQTQQCGGVGRQILEYAEGYAVRTWGVSTLCLNALSNRKQLIAWYVRRGYKETGDTSPFPRERHEGLVLPDDLCFIEFEKKLVV